MEANPKSPVVAVNLDRVQDPALRDVLRNLSRQVENVYGSVSRVVNFNLARQVNAPGPTPPFVKDGESILWKRTDTSPEQYYVVSRFGNRVSLWLAADVQSAPTEPDAPPIEDPTEPPSDPSTITVSSLLPSSFAIEEGAQQVLTVRISDVSAQNTVVLLSSTNSSILQVPPSVTVLPGFLEASFTVQGVSPGIASCIAALNGTSRSSTGTISEVGAGEDPVLPEAGLGIPTFHCIGLYWNPPSDPGERGCPVRYRVNTPGSAWRSGYPLWYDTRSSLRINNNSSATYQESFRARGSIVHLQPDTEYLVQFGMPGATEQDPPVWHNQLVVSTWSESFPEGVTEVVSSRSTQLHITTSGSASGYRVYKADGWAAPGDIGKATINVNKGSPFCIRVSASYVIIRGFALLGADYSGIHVDPGITDVVIEDCDISDWGRVSSTVPGSGYLGGQTFCEQERAGVSLWHRNSPTGGAENDLSQQTKRVVVQRCKIHDPTHGSFPWDYGHPVGASGIFAGESGGNHVFRYNEFYASTTDGTRWMMDAIGGTDNFSSYGCPGRGDCDIYANRISHCYDDAIESEGGNRNTRVWKNYFDKVGVPIACASTHVGPFYAWRNVANRVRFRYNSTYDNDDRPPFFKARSRIEGFGFGGGRQLFFHNTALQHPPGEPIVDGTDPGSVYPQGVGGGVWGGGDDSAGNSQKLINSISRNNIFDMHKYWWESIYDGTPSPYLRQYTIDGVLQGPNSFDYDLTNGDLQQTYPEAEDQSLALGMRKPDSAFHSSDGPHPVYKGGHGPTVNGKYQLASNSPGKAKGAVLNNFSDGFPEAAPDVGAHEEGSNDMVFGIAAWAAGVN